MKESQRPEPGLGSLTPQLEGAARSAAHPERARPEGNVQKGGTSHD